MDVASTLRKEQALVEQQLNLDQIKAKLREKLLDAARVSGDPVTEEQIDAAVRQYYEQLHEFEEPPFGWQTAVAHLWVRRGPLLLAAGFVVAAALAFWGMLAAGMLPGETRDLKLSGQRYAQIESQAQAIEALTSDPTVLAEVAAARTAADGFRQQRDLGQLQAVATEMDALAQALAREYSVSIVAGPGELSGQQRDYTDAQGTRVSGFYVIVEARDAQGRPVALPILNRETGQIERASRWGEQVPQDVFERLEADKRADGVLDERAFGVKRRGERELEIVLPDAAGQPVARQGQITRWE
jgi:hypothetical protein